MLRSLAPSTRLCRKFLLRRSKASRTLAEVSSEFFGLANDFASALKGSVLRKRLDPSSLDLGNLCVYAIAFSM